MVFVESSTFSAHAALCLSEQTRLALEWSGLVKKRDLFSELQQSIAEFREFDAGRLKLRRYEVREPDIAAIRRKTRLSQQSFAALIGVSLRTLQNWEQGHRRPTGPARALLTIVQANPKAAIRALHAQVGRSS